MFLWVSLLSGERDSQTHTLVGLCSVEVTEVVTSRSPPSELHSDTISSHTHSLIDEVEGAAIRVIHDLGMIFTKALMLWLSLATTLRV